MQLVVTREPGSPAIVGGDVHDVVHAMTAALLIWEKFPDAEIRVQTIVEERTFISPPLFE